MPLPPAVPSSPVSAAAPDCLLFSLFFPYESSFLRALPPPAGATKTPAVSCGRNTRFPVRGFPPRKGCVSFIRTITVGTGISPVRHAVACSRTFTAGGDFHSAPKQVVGDWFIRRSHSHSRSRGHGRDRRLRPRRCPGRTPAPGRSWGTSSRPRPAWTRRYKWCCRRWDR